MADLAPSGTLRVAINLGNPVLTHGTPQDPGGVTVDIAREVAARLGMPVEFRCVSAARLSLESLVGGDADLAFLAVDPARSAHVAFTDAYVLIEGVYVVPEDSDLTTVADVDRAGIRIGVKKGSAYDLFLSRTLQQAELVRGDEGTDVYVEQGLEAGAGVRQPVTAWVRAHAGHRVIPERFQEIRQAVATAADRRPESIAWLRDLVEELKRSGFIADSLARAGQADATIAPPA